MRRLRHIAAETLLTLAAIMGVICLLGAAAGFFFDIRPLVFRSGSMSPEIKTGALALARQTPASELDVGDIVSVPNAKGVRVTHRLVAIEPIGGGVYALTMKGDANPENDTEQYLASKADRVMWHQNGLGYVVEEIQKPPYVFGVGVLVGGVLVFSVRTKKEREREPPDDSRGHNEPDDSADDDDPSSVVPSFGAGGGRSGDERIARHSVDEPPDPRSSRITALVALPVLLMSATALIRPQPTLAAFTDHADISSGVASAAMNPYPPTGIKCKTIGVPGRARISWSAPAVAPARYVLSFTDRADVPVSVGTRTYDVTSLLGLGTAITVTVKAVQFGTWVSVGTPSVTVSKNLLGASC
ncbi:signal peptidase I [Antricoccus suffuscus]|uniref:Signal peptidase I n=1 Tax=Antricoccus suffuscus TaxID=1629062 RepID=A0A2T1A1I2_9ACTN|nr:hypothetical protein [Antricoccus suffuscus]PRZ42470.1 signal peptidase I [Antricoccus suffuscus]